MGRHRTADSTGPSAAVQLALRTAAPRTIAPEPGSTGDTLLVVTESPAAPPVTVTLRGAHRVPAPPAALRGRVVVAAVAAGAFVAAGQALASAPSSAGASAAGSAAGSNPGTITLAASTSTGTGGDQVAPQVLSIVKAADPVATAQLAKGQRLGTERAAREAQARRPLYVLPAVGTFTSGFGSRWGTQHLGIDIANAIGTPIVSVADGTVIEAGPASGFGQWVQVQHDDGTITVYGHVNEFIAHAGDRVKAGQEIATIGNRGQSTGPHLHFEVWLDGTEKVDPLPWLAERGINLGPMVG